MFLRFYAETLKINIFLGSIFCFLFFRDVVQLVRIQGWGSCGRTFESCHPDQVIFAMGARFFGEDLFLVPMENVF